MLARTRPPHPLDHQPAWKAILTAGPPLAELAVAFGRSADLLHALAIACGDLGAGFAAPPGSRSRVTAHARAWRAVRDLDRAVTIARRERRATPELVNRAQRAIDRADVMISGLPGVLPV